MVTVTGSVVAASGHPQVAAHRMSGIARYARHASQSPSVVHHRPQNLVRRSARHRHAGTRPPARVPRSPRTSPRRRCTTGPSHRSHGRLDRPSAARGRSIRSLSAISVSPSIASSPFPMVPVGPFVPAESYSPVVHGDMTHPLLSRENSQMSGLWQVDVVGWAVSREVSFSQLTICVPHLLYYKLC